MWSNTTKREAEMVRHDRARERNGAARRPEQTTGAGRTRRGGATDATNTTRECKIPARNARASDGPVGGSTQRIDRILQRSAILQNKKKRQALFRLAEKLADRPRRRGRLSGLRDAGTGLRYTQRDPLGATSPANDLVPKGNTSSWRGNKEGGPGSSRRGSRQHDAG